MRIAIRSPLRAFLVLGGLAGALALLPDWAAAQQQVTITGGWPVRSASRFGMSMSGSSSWGLGCGPGRMAPTG